jgi:hypothetical protein
VVANQVEQLVFADHDGHTVRSAVDRSVTRASGTCSRRSARLGSCPCTSPGSVQGRIGDAGTTFCG